MGSRTRGWAGFALLLAGAAALVGLLRSAAVGREADAGRHNHALPELVGGPWLNTRGSRPIRLAEQRGKVVVLHFWTFG